MKRRDFLFGLFGVSVFASTAIYARGMMGAMMGQSFMGNFDNYTQRNFSFKNPLKIPTQIFGEKVGDTTHFNLNIQKGISSFLSGKSTKTYGVNGSYLGPTIRLKAGQKISLNWRNLLDEATTMHGHGMHVPPSMDGTPHQTILPKESWSANYIVKQKAASNWYHPHTMGKTAEQVLMGLGGMILIDDEDSLKLPLPKRYGVDDIPIIVQDRLFRRDGNFAYPKTMRTIMHGFRGNRFLINGSFAPYVEVEANLLRLRLLNASNARVYSFGIQGVKTFLIAGDNSLLENPIRVQKVILSPAERAEIIIDLKGMKGKKVYLKDYISKTNLLEIRVTKEAEVFSKIPKHLTDLEPIKLNKVVNRRYFHLSMKGPGRLVINGEKMNLNKINEIVKKGEYEIWEIYNEPMGMMGMIHNFHMHGNHFRVLSRNGSKKAVKPWENGYKDTVMIKPGESVEILVRHTDYSDSKIPYMYHCHILEHEDAGMMGQFTVI